MQDLPRLHCPQRLAPGVEVELDEGQARYLGTVLRRSPGDGVRLFNGEDGEWAARIAGLRKQRCTVTMAERLIAPRPEPGPWLVFGLLKRDATDLVVRLATELGAERLLPVTTRRTNAGHTNPARLAAIATEAAEQCERLTVPPIDPVRTLPELLGGWETLAGERRICAAIERDVGAPAPAVVAGGGALLVGPEGGFASEELELLAARPFVTPVSLGPRILRAETAVAAGLARLSSVVSPRLDAHVEPR